MLKTILISSVLGIMLTGCVVAPDDYPRGQKYDDKRHGEGRYKNAHKREWNNAERRDKNRKYENYR